MISKTIGYNGVHYFQTHPNQWTRMVWKTWSFSPKKIATFALVLVPNSQAQANPVAPAAPGQDTINFWPILGTPKTMCFPQGKTRKNLYDSSIPIQDLKFFAFVPPKMSKIPRSTSSQQKAHLPFPAIRFASHRRSHVLVEPDTVFKENGNRGCSVQKKNIFQVSSMKSTKSTLGYFEMIRSFTRPIDPSHPRPAACLWRERTNPGDLGSNVPETIPIITPIPLLYCTLVLHIYIIYSVYIYTYIHMYIYIIYTYTYCIYIYTCMSCGMEPSKFSWQGTN